MVAEIRGRERRLGSHAGGPVGGPGGQRVGGGELGGGVRMISDPGYIE